MASAAPATDAVKILRIIMMIPPRFQSSGGNRINADESPPVREFMTRSHELRCFVLGAGPLENCSFSVRNSNACDCSPRLAILAWLDAPPVRRHQAAGGDSRFVDRRDGRQHGLPLAERRTA